MKPASQGPRQQPGWGVSSVTVPGPGVQALEDTHAPKSPWQATGTPCSGRSRDQDPGTGVRGGSQGGAPSARVGVGQWAGTLLPGRKPWASSPSRASRQPWFLNPGCVTRGSETPVSPSPLRRPPRRPHTCWCPCQTPLLGDIHLLPACRAPPRPWGREALPCLPVLPGTVPALGPCVSLRVGPAASSGDAVTPAAEVRAMPLRGQQRLAH